MPEKVHISLEIEMGLSDYFRRFQQFPVVSFTGVPGVGKSTISRRVAEVLEATYLTELPEGNQFLSAIQTGISSQEVWYGNQNYFLMTDVNQVLTGCKIAQTRPVVFDFNLIQPYLFSQVNLIDGNKRRFNDNFERFFKIAPHPDIIIQLTATKNIILDRLEQRGGFIDDKVQSMIDTLMDGFSNQMLSKRFPKTRVVQFSNIPPAEEVIEVVSNFLRAA